MTWTRCSEQLPDKQDRYLVCWQDYESHVIAAYQYSVEDQRCIWTCGDAPMVGKHAPTHWQHLEPCP